VLKLIIFDWDDVFTLGSKEAYMSCLHETLRDLGISLDPTEEHQRIMEHQGVHPSETVMVGDAKSDVVMAQRAGVRPIVVLTGHLSRGEAETLGVTWILENVTQIESVLQKLDA
jgi:beta-phosphoglucomutase-like phosphatase (HAD superfamily)